MREMFKNNYKHFFKLKLSNKYNSRVYSFDLDPEHFLSKYLFPKKYNIQSYENDVMVLSQKFFSQAATSNCAISRAAISQVCPSRSSRTPLLF